MDEAPEPGPDQLLRHRIRWIDSIGINVLSRTEVRLGEELVFLEGECKGCHKFVDLHILNLCHDCYSSSEVTEEGNGEQKEPCLMIKWI